MARFCFDKEKAFSCVSYILLDRVLWRSKIGEKFCSYINLMYQNIFTKFLVNSWQTDPFQVFSLVRVFFLFVLSSSWHQNPQVRRITLLGQNWQVAKCSLYVDDVTIYCTDHYFVMELVETHEELIQALEAMVNCRMLETLFFVSGPWLPLTPLASLFRSGLGRKEHF